MPRRKATAKSLGVPVSSLPIDWDLSREEKRFCEYYAEHGHGERAAAVISAYKSMLDSANPQTKADRLLEREPVRRYLKHLLDKKSSLVRVNQLDILSQLSHMSFADPRGLFSDSGRLLPMNEWPDGLSRCIRRIKVTQSVRDEGDPVDIIDIHIEGRVAPLKLLGEHLGMFIPSIAGNLETEDLGQLKQQLEELEAEAQRRKILPTGYQPSGPVLIDGESEEVED